MKLLSALPVRIKLPMVIVGLCLVTGVVLEIMNMVSIRSDSRHVIDEQFDGIGESRKLALQQLLARTETDLNLLSQSAVVANALGSLGSAYRLLPDATSVLQKAYLDDNPNPVGQRQALDKAEGDASYHRQHATFHPEFRNVQEKRGLYDVFLFDLDLNNVYTVFKETDFAASFRSGPLAESGLGRALKKAEMSEPGQVVFSDLGPYAPSNGTYAAFVVAKVASRAGITMGYVAFQLNTTELAVILDDRTGLGETGRVYLVGLAEGNGKGGGFVLGTGMANRLPEDVEGTVGPLDTTRIWPHVEALKSGQEGFFEDVTLASGETGFASTIRIETDGANWGLIVERDAADVYASGNALAVKSVLIGLSIMVVAAVCSMVFARSLTRPLSRISVAINAIANGDLQVRVVDADRQDELGMIATALNGLLDKLTVSRLAEEERERLQEELRVVVDRLSAGLQGLADGDLSRPIEESFAADYEQLRVDFNSSLQNLAVTMVEVIDASQSIRARSTEISAASEDLSRRTENQAAALEETAAALDELTASVKSAAEGAREVETIVRSARKEAEDSGVVVQGAVAAMAEIEKSSEQISQIIGAIDDIAFQTNLLALNAGVEAARAGDAGKGFAVVASEVRALAQRSSAAAKEIKALIVTSAQHVGRGVDQVGKAGEALHNIVGSVANISSLVSTIAAGAAEQSTGLAEINIGVTQLDQVTQQNAAMVEEATAASHSLHQDATGLAGLVARFKTPQSTATGETRDIAVTQFAPTDFASSEAPEVEPLNEEPIRPVRVANAPNKAMWQEF